MSKHPLLFLLATQSVTKLILPAANVIAQESGGGIDAHGYTVIPTSPPWTELLFSSPSAC